MSEDQKRPKVVLVSIESIQFPAKVQPGVVEVRYIRERDEPAFERTWQRLRELEAHGKLKPTPTLPPGGIRLRGSRTKQAV